MRDQLGIQYLAALDKVSRARQRLNQAVTITNSECAKTELRRVEEYRFDVLRQITDHCEAHECATRELEEICGHSLETRKLAVA